MIPAVRGPLPAIALGAIVIAAGSALIAQSALSQIGVAEVDAQRYVLENINAAHYGIYLSDPCLGAYRKLPATAKGPVTTGLYAWTKTYVNSPAFKKTYAERRADSVPV